MKTIPMSARKTAAELATPQELAKKYRVAVSTFMSWHHAGIFQAEIAVGRVYRFDEDQVDAGLELHARKNAKKKTSASLA